MGQKKTCYIGQRAALVTYSNENLAAFLQEKGITLNSPQFPFEKVEDFLIVYLDDLVIWSSKKIQDSTKVHQLLIKFLLWCTIKLGFKFPKSKVHIMPITFKLLGHQINTLENSTSIPDIKLSAFQELCPPQSTAEPISRLGTISYFSSYIPLLRIVTHPIQKMVTEGIFKWDTIHQMSWDSMKLLCSLKIVQ